MAEAYIVDAVRTPVGRRGGGLSQVHPADLGGALDQGAHRAGGRRPGRDRRRRVRQRRQHRAATPATSPAPVGSSTGFPEHVPGTTVDRQCGSAQQAVHFAAQAVMSGTMDLVVAGGVQNMSQIPIMSAMVAGPGSTGTRRRSPTRRAGRRATATRRSRSSAAPR